jgi:hypothetical protein
MHHDQHHNSMTGSADAVDRYDTALDDLLAYRPAVLDHLGTFAEHDTDVPMAQVMTAYLQLTSTDARDLGGARETATVLAGLDRNEREQMHTAAIDAWISGDWIGASGRLDQILVRWPTDLLALLVGHQLDFFLGDAANLRDRVGRSLGALDMGHHHRGFVLGMHSFGLEESGHYEASEQAGLAALVIHPDDVWATHAVAHGYEMQGRVERGISFLTDSVPNWGAGNLFTVHMWWHLALYLLEQRRIDEVLSIYDREVHHGDSLGVPIEMLDASALLWRLYVDGIDTGGRFHPLADAWRASIVEQPWYVFNDVHAVMALVGADRVSEAHAHVARLEVDLADGADRPTHREVVRVAGLPAAQAVVAFAEGRHDDVVDLLLPARRVLHRFGGSHAQRDAMQRTLVESAIRSGRNDIAAALIRERLSVRPNGEFALARVPRVGDQAVRTAALDDMVYTSKMPASSVPA